MGSELADHLASGEDIVSAMIVQAHPDDEVIGIGGHLPQFRSAVLVHLTEGAPTDGRDALASGCASPAEYARTRRAELECALELAGIRASQLLELHCPDQQASRQMAPLALAIWNLIAWFRPIFPIAIECVRDAPQYDFSAPPHCGNLFYEQFAWEVNSRRFIELATQACRELGLTEVM